MAAEAVKVYGYEGGDYYGTAAPARAPYFEPGSMPVDAPIPHEVAHPGVRAKEAAAQRTPLVSVFAVFGTVFVGILMVIVVLAQIRYSEIADETARLNAQLGELQEQERRLGIMFENAIDMTEVERYARDTLGMSKPDADQVIVIRSRLVDTAEIIDNSGETGTSGGLGSFISSLLDYFR